VLCWAPLHPRLRVCHVPTDPKGPPPASHLRPHARPCLLRTPATHGRRCETVGTVPRPPTHGGDAVHMTHRRTARAPPAQVGNTHWATLDRAPSTDAGGPPTAPPGFCPPCWVQPCDPRQTPPRGRGSSGHLRGALLACAPDSRWDGHPTGPHRDGHTWTTATGDPSAGKVCTVIRRRDAVRQPSGRARHTPVAHRMQPRAVPQPHSTDRPRRERLRDGDARHTSPPSRGAWERHATTDAPRG